MLKPLNVVVIDDEKPAIDILSRFVNKLSFLDLVLATTDAFEGLTVLNTQNIDILLIDIKMPDISGIELIKSLKSKPYIVLTTAYKEYALEGFELDVIDYLLKPIRFERFLKAMNKVHAHYNLMFNREEAHDSLLIKVNYKTIRLSFSDILYIEGCKDYVKVFTMDTMFLTRLNLKNIQEKLPDKEFLRIHRSFIVSISKISSFQRNEVYIANKLIPIGEFYKESVSKRLM